MNGLAIRAVGALLVALLAAAGFVYVQDLRGDLATTSQALQAAQRATVERDGTIQRLQNLNRVNDEARRQLANEQTSIKAALDLRETQIRNLENENAELRAWSAAPLPGPAVRLLEHGPITGAAAYRKRLSAGAALHAAGRAPGN